MKLTDKARAALLNATQDGDTWTVAGHPATRRSLHRAGMVEFDGHTLTALGVETLTYLAGREWDTASNTDGTLHLANLAGMAREAADTDARTEGFDRYTVRWYRAALAALAVYMDTVPEDLTGTYRPFAPGARTIAEAEPLTVDGEAVSVTVTNRTAAVMIGERVHGYFELGDDMQRDGVNPWAVALVAELTTPEPEPEPVAATVARHKATERHHITRREESWERSGMDGARTQYAHGLMAQEERLAARIAEKGGMWEFPALFDLSGNLVPARQVQGRYGYCWRLLDASGRGIGWFNESQARKAENRRNAHARKGFYVGTVLAPAVAELDGGGVGSVMAVAKRTDGGWNPNVTVVDSGREAATGVIGLLRNMLTL